MTDHEAYEAYPDDNHWYDKLFVANTFGYRAGTESIPTTGIYIVRPIINLDGGGIGAHIGMYRSGDEIPQFHFWCETFYGRHITIDYTRVNGEWVQGNTFEGENRPRDLIHFLRWCRVDYPYPLPQELVDVQSDHINLEMIDGRIIEVHLRHNTDPVQHDVFIPIWCEDTPPPGPDWIRIPDPEDHIDRLGFYVPTNNT